MYNIQLKHLNSGLTIDLTKEITIEQVNILKKYVKDISIDEHTGVLSWLELYPDDRCSIICKRTEIYFNVYNGPYVVKHSALQKINVDAIPAGGMGEYWYPKCYKIKNDTENIIRVYQCDGGIISTELYVNTRKLGYILGNEYYCRLKEEYDKKKADEQEEKRIKLAQYKKIRNKLIEEASNKYKKYMSEYIIKYKYSVKPKRTTVESVIDQFGDSTTFTNLFETSLHYKLRNEIEDISREVVNNIDYKENLKSFRNKLNDIGNIFIDKWQIKDYCEAVDFLYELVNETKSQNLLDQLYSRLVYGDWRYRDCSMSPLDKVKSTVKDIAEALFDRAINTLKLNKDVKRIDTNKYRYIVIFEDDDRCTLWDFIHYNQLNNRWEIE